MARNPHQNSKLSIVGLSAAGPMQDFSIMASLTAYLVAINGSCLSMQEVDL